MDKNFKYPYFTGLNVSNIKDFIRHYREINNITLDEMAYETGISRATLNRLEKGEANPTLRTINALNDLVSKLMKENKADGIDVPYSNTLPNIIDNLNRYISQLELDLIYDETGPYLMDANGTKFPLTEYEIRNIDDSVMFQIEYHLEECGVKIPFPSWLVMDADDKKVK